MFCRYLNLEGERHGMAILPGWFFFEGGFFGGHEYDYGEKWD